MEERDLHWATLCEAYAAAIGDEEALTQGEVRRTWAELDDRAGRLASALLEAGLGPGSKVAQYLYNGPEYVETYLGTLKIRGVPVNVNYRYVEEEVAYLLENADAEALFFHASLSDKVEAVLDRLPKLKLVVQVGEPGAGVQPEGPGLAYEELIGAHAPVAPIERSPLDTVMTYTGGTTGMPKGVMARIGRGIPGLLLAVSPTLGLTAEQLELGPGRLAALLAENDNRLVTLPACPLMHGTGMVIGLHTALATGGKMALLSGRHFDPVELWDTVEREGVRLVGVVGDPFARPMLAALEGSPGRWDLSRLGHISSAGAMFSEEVREGLIRHIPSLTILDYISATEGLMGLALSRAGEVAPTGVFNPAPGVKVFSVDDEEVSPGSGDAGMVALSVGVPDGYYKDEAKSARTFREIDGTRYSVPGDWAVVEGDGRLRLMGRGSQCINTGGEKVYPEEVEEVLKRHRDIEDALVFGVPDERFGQRVAAVASVRQGAAWHPAAVLEEARSKLASYKVPRVLQQVHEVPRGPSGKADYPEARRLWEASAKEDAPTTGA